jgi:hypothetical protein
MADVRSGLCHGPYCTHPITGSSPSEDFCSDECQTAWNALHAHPPMPPLSINLPGPSLARWTPEGGAPITPETSTWEPRQTSVTPTMPSSIQEGDVLVVVGSGAMAVGRAGATTFGALMADLEEGICIECGRLRYEHHGGTCPPVPDQRSWWSRLWTWMWLRG